MAAFSASKLVWSAIPATVEHDLADVVREQFQLPDHFRGLRVRRG
jgi:hypothetical protein